MTKAQVRNTNGMLWTLVDIGLFCSKKETALFRTVLSRVISD